MKKSKNDLKSILYNMFDDYEEVDDIISNLRSLESDNEITSDEYDEIMDNYDSWLTEYEKKEQEQKLKNKNKSKVEEFD